MKKAEKEKIKQNELAVVRFRDEMERTGFSKIRPAANARNDNGGGGSIFTEYGSGNERVLLRQDYDDNLNIVAFRVFHNTVDADGEAFQPPSTKEAA